MSMPAIRDRQVVFRAYGADGADGNGFLALCEVCRAGDETLHEELLDLVLKGAAQDHGAKPRPAAFRGARLLHHISPHALRVHFLRQPRNTLSTQGCSSAVVTPRALSNRSSQHTASRGCAWASLMLWAGPSRATHDREYAVALQGLQGDWYEAAEIHRRWSLQQHW